MELAQKLRLMLVTDGLSRGNLSAVVESAISGGVRAVQLREKETGACELSAIASQLREVTRARDALLLINDRVDVALAVGADGVHLGWRSLTVSQARSLMGPDAVIGVSTHTVDEACLVAEEGADYVTFGPVFDTPSKRGLIDTQGLEQLSRCVRSTSIPVIAIGGMTPEVAASVRDSGATGMAAIRGLTVVANPEEAAAGYLQMWESASSARISPQSVG